MLRVVLAAGAALMLVGSSLAVMVDDSPKYTISEVMNQAHKGKDSLLGKVKSGKANAAEKAKLVEYYQSMVMNKPEKGDAAGFKKMADSLLTAATAVKKGDKTGLAQLNKASNCKACHDIYK